RTPEDGGSVDDVPGAIALHDIWIGQEECRSNFARTESKASRFGCAWLKVRAEIVTRLQMCLPGTPKYRSSKRPAVSLRYFPAFGPMVSLSTTRSTPSTSLPMVRALACAVSFGTVPLSVTT